MPATERVNGVESHLVNGTTIEALARNNGVKVTMRTTVRLPITCYADLVQMIERLKLTGRVSVDFSQGKGGWVTWEGPKTESA